MDTNEKRYKHPLFAPMGDEYPTALETQFERIIFEIEDRWKTPEIDDYLSELLIDRRGGRKGFPGEVVKDILAIREFRESERISEPERAEQAIQALLELGYTQNTFDFERALRSGEQRIVDLYVRARFNVRYEDSSGSTPLLKALKRGHTVCADILLKAGSDPNARDKLGLTPLLIACGKPTQGYRNITAALIRRRAAINVADPMGNTPLTLAISGGMYDIAALLVERGAKLKATNRKGESALTLLQALGDPAEGSPLALLLEKIREREEGQPQREYPRG